MIDKDRAEWISNATPHQIVERYPFEYTLNMRMGPTKWHLSASYMSPLEQDMYRLASDLRQYENELKL